MTALVSVGLSFGLEPTDGAKVHKVEKVESGGRVAIPSWIEAPRE
jgi:hypothetical protein